MPELIGSQIESVNRFIQCEQQNGVQRLRGQCLDRVLTGSLVFSLQRIKVCVCVCDFMCSWTSAFAHP